MKRFFAAAGMATLLLSNPASAQYKPYRMDNGDWANFPLTVDQAWENGALTYNEFRHMRYFDHYDTIPYKQGDNAPWLEFREFRNVMEEDFRSADRNGNGRIDSETERCLFHRTAEGRMAGGIGFSAGDLDRATVARQAWIASQRTWQGPTDKTFSGEWPKVTQDQHNVASKPQTTIFWKDIPGCAFMAKAAVTPASPASPPVAQPAVPAVPAVPAAPALPAAAACTPPSQKEAQRIVFSAWSDGRLTREEAATLNTSRHCQLDQDRSGSLSEAEFVALSLADFDRADRNKDGVLSGQRELGGLANAGNPAQAGLTRQQATDVAKLRFAVLDRQPRDQSVTLAEYLAVTAEEFSRGDANGDGALTLQEAARQKPAQ